MKRKDVVGREFDRFAIDEDEHVGHFSTAGYGATPKNVFDEPAQESIEQQVLALPLITVAEVIRPDSGKIDD